MVMRQTAEVARAIEMLRADPKLTRYAAAKANGITPAALYNSKRCRELMEQRKTKKEKRNASK